MHYALAIYVCICACVYVYVCVILQAWSGAYPQQLGLQGFTFAGSHSFTTKRKEYKFDNGMQLQCDDRKRANEIKVNDPDSCH
jgi:DMSO/TMAO reductase YedYZ heme-binding membrane subunit